jgi:hypothetical protein
MGRFCYRSKILPGKSDFVREHWKKKQAVKSCEMKKEEEEFWSKLQMTGFNCFLQSTPQGDFMLHCLEGTSFELIFKELRDAIQKKNPIALGLQKFYQDALGKDYSLPSSEPKIECIADLSQPQRSPTVAKKAFFFPLLKEKELEHCEFRKNSMGENRTKHEAAMRAFGVFRHIVWLQQDETGPFIVIDSDREFIYPTVKERLSLGDNSPEWKEISSILIDHTGLSYQELSPYVELLTRS